ncbi:MAG: biotin/lipoate A/B protein ligase family protein, partial [Ktedonobacterales bacterium]
RQLALSEALLAGLAEHAVPAVRWYIARHPALVLGNGQSPAAVNLAACHARGIHVYRRTSGGTAVLVDGDVLSMEVALPTGHPLAITDIVRGYQWIGEIWATALHALGIRDARALPTNEVRALSPLAKDDPLRLACYGTLSPWEPVVGRRKIVGLSQVRRRAGVLYQMGVHLRWQPSHLVELLALPAETRDALGPRLASTTAGLDELAGRSVSAEEVTAAVNATLAESLGIRLELAEWAATERAAAVRIQHERFRALV